MSKIKTSKIIIRPFIPSMKNEKEEGREPFAVLKFGNVEVELDYTVMRCLDLDIKNECFVKAVSIANASFREIVKEMEFVLYGRLPDNHRDSKHPYLSSLTHNPLHPNNPEITVKTVEERTGWVDLGWSDVEF